mmetsp:Transcript_26904/g.52720  ORF Transcript_26904/g.52720 Transcript_26904/m.52720 type:complete len:623 (-) Transcript_26904:116-1984(-)
MHRWPRQQSWRRQQLPHQRQQQQQHQQTPGPRVQPQPILLFDEDEFLGEGDDDAAVLEAERELAEYLAVGSDYSASSLAVGLGDERRIPGSNQAARNSRRQAASPTRSASTPARRGDLVEILKSHIHALGEEVLSHDAALESMRREAAAAPRAEVEALFEENAILACQTQEALEEVSELGTARGTLQQEADSFHREVQDLQVERDDLAQRLRGANALAAEAREASDLVSRALDVERHRSNELVRNIEGSLRQRQRRLASAEEGTAGLSRQFALLEADNAAVGLQADNEAKTSKTEQEAWRCKAAQLQASLEEARHQKFEDEARDREESRALSEARGAMAAAEATVEVLMGQLQDSEHLLGETERRAVGVAHELLDTSQSIARLRQEAEAQRGLRPELEEAQREEGTLEQRLESVRREQALACRGASCEMPVSTGADESEEPVEPYSGEGASAVDDGLVPQLSSSGQLTAADLELRRLRASQEQAVGEALRSAWEAEVRERRATEARLEALQAEWPAMRDWLMRLTSAARRWREEYFSGGPGLGPSVPPPPAESAWCCEQQTPQAAKELCDCLEAIAIEGRQRLSQARTVHQASRHNPRHSPQQTAPWSPLGFQAQLPADLTA